MALFPAWRARISAAASECAPHVLFADGSDWLDWLGPARPTGAGNRSQLAKPQLRSGGAGIWRKRFLPAATAHPAGSLRRALNPGGAARSAIYCRGRDALLLRSGSQCAGAELG